MQNKVLFLLWIGALLAGSGVAPAETITLNPSADATLFEVNPGNSAGGAAFFNSGTTQNRMKNRALLQFDIASMVPAGAHITSVGLQLEVLRVPVDGFEISFFGLHRMLRPWVEGTTFATTGMGSPAQPGDATWNYASASGDSWSEPGGGIGVDFAAQQSSGVFIYGLGTYQFEGTADLANEVQTWLDHPESNFGWLLFCETEELPFTARRFGSREDPQSAPVLTIEFVTVPEPGVMALGAVGLAILLGWRSIWRTRLVR